MPTGEELRIASEDGCSLGSCIFGNLPPVDHGYDGYYNDEDESIVGEEDDPDLYKAGDA